MEELMDLARRLVGDLGDIERVYEYLDAEGRLLFCNLRIRSHCGKKTFRMMSDGGNGFELKRHESLRPQAGWPLCCPAVPGKFDRIWVVEGEKDIESLTALGLKAVTSGGTNTDTQADSTS